MKNVFKGFVAANLLLAMLMFTSVKAQTTVEIFLNGGPASSSYAGYVINSTFTLRFSNPFSNIQLPAGSFRIQASVPTGVEFAATSDYTPPTGWTYTRVTPTSIRLIPNATVSADAVASAVEFIIPIKTTGPVGAGNNYVAVPQAETQSAGTYLFPTTDNNKVEGPITVANEPLPVDFSSFTATAKGCSVVLNWTTASEKNNSHFVIERSNGGSEYKAIGQTNGAGTSYEAHSYSYVDETPAKLQNLYRIRQVDFDGQSSPSVVRNANVDCQNNAISIYPNPAKSNVFYVKGLTNKSTIEVYNAVGQRVVSKTGENTLEGVSLSGLASGVYHVQIVSEGQTVFSSKLIKD